MATLSDPAVQDSALREARFAKADALEFDSHHYRESLAERAKHDAGTNALMDERRGGPWGGRPFTQAMNENYDQLVRGRIENPAAPPLTPRLIQKKIHDEARIESVRPHWRKEFSNGGSVPVPSLAAPEFSDGFDRHDEAYSTATISRAEADWRLYQDMLAAADRVADPARRQALREKAILDYLGVRAFGLFGFYKPR